MLFVNITSFLQDSTLVGRVDEIISADSCSTALVVIDLFELAASRHEIFDMPWLQRPFGQVKRIAVLGQVRAMQMIIGLLLRYHLGRTFQV